MKKIVMAIAAMGLMTALAGAAHAQVYGYPYGYAYPPDPYAAYDPYYELHVIHYQLYLGSYGYYPYPYFVPSAPVIFAPPVVAAPVRQPLGATAPIVRKR